MANKIIISIFILLLPLNNCLADNIKYILLLSGASRPYLDFAEGFSKTEPKSKFYFWPEEEINFLRALKKWPQAEIVAVGTRALERLKALKLKKNRLFYALVLSPPASDFGPRLCGLYLRLPPRKTFPLLRDFFEKRWPGPQEGYVLLVPYLSSENQKFIAEMKKEAPKWDFKINDFVPSGINSLKNQILNLNFDLLYAIPDPLFASEEAIKMIIKTALLAGKGVCGYNRFFYEQGALISFVFDYYQIGLEAPKEFEHGCFNKPAPFEVLINEKVLNFLHKKFKMQKNKK